MVHVPLAASSAPSVRQRLARDLVESGVPTTQAEDACLVLAELVGNAVRHGAPLAGGVLEVDWCVVDGVVEVRVTDGGAGVPRQRTAAVGAESGRGLAIVDAVAASWGVARPAQGGTTVWARVSR
ncbi:MAG TPA: ATP-binding protein [Mycobacteriales bacterium]